MEFYNICPHYINQKIGFISKKDYYLEIYNDLAEELDLRDILYYTEFEGVEREKFILDVSEPEGLEYIR